MKKAIVVGASSGIGYGIATVLANNNYNVGITGRRIGLLRALKKTKPNAFYIQAFDVSNVASVATNIQALVNQLGGLDLLILSAGTGELNEQLAFDKEQQTIETNVLGFTSVATWAFNYFEQQGYGHLVAITSVGGSRGSRIAPAYNASKAFQINYVEGLQQKATALAAKNKKIDITDIRPGFVDTAMAKGEGQFWVAPVNKAVVQIYNGIVAKNKVVYITKRWRLMGILLKLIPRWIYCKL